MWAGALGVAVLVATGIIGWPFLVEQYYIHRLASSDETIRVEAVDRLSWLKSAKAVPLLSNRLISLQDTVDPTGMIDGRLEAGHISSALQEIGRPAIPALLKIAVEADEPLAVHAVEVLKVLYGQPFCGPIKSRRDPDWWRCARDFLNWIVEREEDVRIRELAADALKETESFTHAGTPR